MRDPDHFDAVYASARERLLVQAYALTGDLSASQDAVKDAFVAAWHHWRKVERLDQPESWIRPLVMRLAQRKQTTRVWHREKPDDAEVAATLDALHKLPAPQRRLLVLNHLAVGTTPEFAREVGVTAEQAERGLQTASAAFALQRGVPAALVGPTLEELRPLAAALRWPRPSILRRAGTARRRSHSLLGAAVAVVTLVAGGALTLGTESPRLHDGVMKPAAASEPASAEPTDDASEEPGEAAPELAAENLLTADQLRRLAPSRAWSELSTDANTEGDGLALPCQQARYADPDGHDALVRRFEAARKKRQPSLSAVQFTELSGSEKSAEAAYATMRDWFGGCTDAQTQLLDSATVSGVGDDATMLTLRTWAKPARAYTAAIARSGQIVTTTVTTIAGQAPPDPTQQATLLAAAVNTLCGANGAATCAAPPRAKPTAVPATGAAPGMLSEIDLPPVRGVKAAWVGTEPRKAMTNVAATQCDQADFATPEISNALTRTFVLPEGRLPLTFGLTETVGTLPKRQARAFVDSIERGLARCEDKHLGTSVTSLRDTSDKAGELHAWRLEIELTDTRSVTVYMGAVRSGTAVAQVGFTPVKRALLTDDDFLAVLTRAQMRLDHMPAPTKAPAPKGQNQRKKQRAKRG